MNIAKIAHEVNRAYCQAIGDFSLSSWDEAPRWQQDTVQQGVQFHMVYPDAGPEASHENWLKQKKAEGWKYGEVKDPYKKEHPCMVPYKSLPREHKAKDYIFHAIVHALIKEISDENN